MARVALHRHVPVLVGRRANDIELRVRGLLGAGGGPAMPWPSGTLIRSAVSVAAL